MCSAADDPTTYDAPTPQPPRRYVLSGDAPAREPASVALAVLGTVITREEAQVESLLDGSVLHLMAQSRVDALREARDAVAEAEVQLR